MTIRQGLIALITFLAGTVAQAATLSADLNIPYERLAEIYSAHYKAAFSPILRTENCNDVGTSRDTRPKEKQYGCGELPFGDIKSHAWKSIMTVKIPKTKGKDGSVKYNIDSGELEVLLSRQQRAGAFDLPDLDIKARGPSPISSRLGDDIRVLLDPRNSILDKELCLGLPGLSAKADTVKLKGAMTKTIAWLPDIHAKLAIRVDVGQFSFTSGQLCGSFATSIDDKGLPSIALKTLSAPTLTDVAHSGLKVDVDANVSGFWGVINTLTKTLGYDIEKIIAKAVRERVRAVAQREINITTVQIRRGTWFEEFVNVAALQKTFHDFSQQLGKHMKSIGKGQQPIERIVHALCAQVAGEAGLSSDIKKAFFKICAFTPDIKLALFLDDTLSRQNGCYSYFFNPRTSGKWWGESCEISNRLEIEVSPLVKELTQCLLASWQEKHKPAEYCKNEIQAVVDHFTNGQLDDLLNGLPASMPQVSDEDYALLVRLLKQRLGIDLPSYQDFLGLF